MSPIEYIEKGICSGDWSIVCEGYKMLTGKFLPTPVCTDAESIVQQISDIILNRPKNETQTQTLQKKAKPILAKKKAKKKTVPKEQMTKKGQDAAIKISDNDITKTQKQADGVRFITNECDPEEVKQNKQKAKRARANKLKINKVKDRTYKANCNECQGEFESSRPNGEMGQKCPKCLKNLKGRFV